MVEVTVSRNSDGRIRAFTVTGHCLYDRKGRDIVCAAISALTQTAVLGLEERLGLRPRVTIREGDLKLVLPPDLGVEMAARAQDILETMVIGLKAMQHDYGAHLRLVEETL